MQIIERRGDPLWSPLQLNDRGTYLRPHARSRDGMRGLAYRSMHRQGDHKGSPLRMRPRIRDPAIHRRNCHVQIVDNSASHLDDTKISYNYFSLTQLLHMIFS